MAYALKKPTKLADSSLGAGVEEALGVRGDPLGEHGSSKTARHRMAQRSEDNAGRVPSGYVLAQGRSSFDGSSIVAIAVGFGRASLNRKTGPLIQVYVLPEGAPPFGDTRIEQGCRDMRGMQAPTGGARHMLRRRCKGGR